MRHLRKSKLTNIPAPDDEKRYSPILKADGTRDELLDWRLYFKKEEDGGLAVTLQLGEPRET